MLPRGQRQSGGVRTGRVQRVAHTALVLVFMCVTRARNSDASICLHVVSRYVACASAYTCRRMSAPHAPAFACLCDMCFNMISDATTGVARSRQTAFFHFLLCYFWAGFGTLAKASAGCDTRIATVSTAD